MIKNILIVVALLAMACSTQKKEESRWCDRLPRPAYDTLTKTDHSNYWFEVYVVQDSIYAIYEPYQWQEVISYLIIGREFALLFDTGNGIGNINEVVTSITDLPIRVLNSHSHYDHVGGNADFEFIYGMDTEFTRGRAAGLPHERVAAEVSQAALCKPLPDGVVAENHRIRSFTITETVRDGYVIDLGNRQLEVLSIPGHTPDAIALFDKTNGLLWTGDSFYLGPIWLFAPETDLSAYKNSMSQLAILAPSLKFLLPAHNTPLAHAEVLTEVDAGLKAVEAGTIDPIKTEEGTIRYNFKNFSFLFASPD